MAQAGPLEGKVAVVTGAGTKPSDGGAFGTGKATAVLLAEDGARVVLVDRHEDRVEATRQDIEDAGGVAATVVADLSDELTCQRVVDEAVAAFGRLDILVNNVAVNSMTGLLDSSVADWEKSLAVNLTVPFLLTKAAVPVMVDGGGGSIVNISSIAAVSGGQMCVPYATAKAGLAGLTTSVANEFGTKGVRVNTIVVGGIVTAFQQNDMRAVAGSPTTRTVSGVAGDAWDIAHAARFLAGPDARHVTGVCLRVDGGATIIVTPMPPRLVGEPSPA